MQSAFLPIQRVHLHRLSIARRQQRHRLLLRLHVPAILTCASGVIFSASSRRGIVDDTSDSAAVSTAREERYRGNGIWRLRLTAPASRQLKHRGVAHRLHGCVEAAGQLQHVSEILD